MSHYVEVIGPYDSAFIGPFETAAQAEQHKEACIKRHGNIVFDFYVMDQNDMDESLKTYGFIPLQAPEAWA